MDAEIHEGDVEGMEELEGEGGQGGDAEPAQGGDPYGRWWGDRRRPSGTAIT
jgi:hypothetical protein